MILLVQEVSLIAYVSGVTGLKEDVLNSIGRVQYVLKSLPQVSYLKTIIIRRLPMNRIKRLNRFIDDYSRLNPYLKDLLKEVHLSYQQELIQEYTRISHYNNQTGNPVTVP